MNIKNLIMWPVAAALIFCSGCGATRTASENKTIIKSDLTVVSYDKSQLINDADVILRGKVESVLEIV